MSQHYLWRVCGSEVGSVWSDEFILRSFPFLFNRIQASGVLSTCELSFQVIHEPFEKVTRLTFIKISGNLDKMPLEIELTRIYSVSSVIRHVIFSFDPSPRRLNPFPV